MWYGIIGTLLGIVICFNAPVFWALFFGIGAYLYVRWLFRPDEDSSTIPED